MMPTGEWGPPCTVKGCKCTHTGDCDRGWVDWPDRTQNGQTYVRVAPCAICRPMAYTKMSREVTK